MRKMGSIVGILVLGLLFSAAPILAAGVSAPAGPHDILVVSGTVSNPQGKGIRYARVRFFANGKAVSPGGKVFTSSAGTFKAEILFPQGSLPQTAVAMESAKPSFKSSGRIVLSPVVKEMTDSKGNTFYLAHENIRLQRVITPAFRLALVVLLGVYALIAFDLVHRTLAAFMGASLILLVTYTAGAFKPDFVVLTFQDAMHAIDLNVIFLLMAMMIIVGVMKKTGVFHWLAYESFKLSRGNVFVLAAIAMAVTAVTSMFLDNVTTMLLIIPVTLELAQAIDLNPVTFLLPEIFASNVGGTSTLIGDPPNIMIGSYAKLSFLDFVLHLAGVCFIILAVAGVYYLYWYKKDYLKAQVGNVGKVTERLRQECQEVDKKLLKKCILALGLTIFLFVIHGALGMEPSIAAMAGATLLLIISEVDIVAMLEHEIDWPTLIFFMMLFIVVAGAEETGLTQFIADGVYAASRGSLVMAISIILWVSTFASAIIDNTPLTATMLPIVGYLSSVLPGAQTGILWWALALGVCLGGNGTMIGATANLVTVGVAERAGYRISFKEYLKVSYIPVIISVVICNLWLVAMTI